MNLPLTPDTENGLGKNRFAKNNQCFFQLGGFTLLELLVVISIIALLASLLLPALASAKGNARKMECLGRMRQWASAFMQYTGDNNDWIPREGYDPWGETYLNNWAQVSGRPLATGGTDSQDVWYNALLSYLSVPPAAFYAEEKLRPGFYKPQSLFHCPSARFPPETSKENQSYALFSIALNSQLIKLPNIPSIKFSRIRRPSNTVLFADNRLDKESKVQDYQPTDNLGQPAVYVYRVAARHQEKINLIFGDSHVQSIRKDRVVEMQGENLGGPAQSTASEILWDLED